MAAAELTPVAQVLSALLLGGIGLPIPEDLALLAAGYLAWRGDAPPLVLGLAALAGVLGSDLILFAVGRRFGRHPALLRRMTPARIAWIERAFARHGARLVLVARLAFGARALFFLGAGLARMPLARLLAWDALGASLAVTLWLAVGLLFGERIEALRQGLRAAEVLVPVVLLLLLLVAAKVSIKPRA